MCTGAAAAVLVPDLRERGMLGDSGANLLGFLAGAEIVRRLPEVWLIPAVVVVIGLNVLAETVTVHPNDRGDPPAPLVRPPRAPSRSEDPTAETAGRVGRVC